MTTNDLAFVPVNFDSTTILLGYIMRVRNQPTSSLAENYPAEVILTNGDQISIPLTVEQATDRMYRRVADFKRLLRG